MTHAKWLLASVLLASVASAQVYNYYPPPGVSYTAASGTMLGAATGGLEGYGTLNAQGLYVNGVPVSTSSGTVSGVSVVSANGFSGVVTNPTTMPSITLATTFTGIGYSNGGALSAAIASNFPTLNQNTTGQAGTALALAATPTPCSSGQAPTGVLANGNSTGCFATLALINETANTAFMGPISGGAATPAFRALVANDLPAVLNGGTSVNGVFAGVSVSANGYGSANTGIQSTLIGTTGIGYVGLGLNGFYNGSYWCTGTDGASNGASYITTNYGSSTPTISFYAVPSSGGTSQCVTNSQLQSIYLTASVGPSGTTIGAPTGGAAGAGTLNATGVFINGSSVATYAANPANFTHLESNGNPVAAYADSPANFANLQDAGNPVVTYTSGSFTLTTTGCSPNTSVTVVWYKLPVVNLVTMFIPAISCISNAGTFTLTGLPTAIQPIHQLTYVFGDVEDNGVTGNMGAGIISTSTITMLINKWNGTYIQPSASWTSGGGAIKGLGENTNGVNMIYGLN